MKIRPQILIAMIIVGIIAICVSWFGWKMDSTEIVTGAGVGSITGLITLATKIIDSD
jgi:L-lactate permease